MTSTSSFNMSSGTYRVFYRKTKIYGDTIHFTLDSSLHKTSEIYSWLVTSRNYYWKFISFVTKDFTICYEKYLMPQDCRNNYHIHLHYPCFRSIEYSGRLLVIALTEFKQGHRLGVGRSRIPHHQRVPPLLQNSPLQIRHPTQNHQRQRIRLPQLLQRLQNRWEGLTPPPFFVHEKIYVHHQRPGLSFGQWKSLEFQIQSLLQSFIRTQLFLTKYILFARHYVSQSVAFVYLEI